MEGVTNGSVHCSTLGKEVGDEVWELFDEVVKGGEVDGKGKGKV